MQVLRDIEEKLYGTAKTNASLPTPAEVLDIVSLGVNLLDSDGNYILDSDDRKMQTMMYA